MKRGAIVMAVLVAAIGFISGCTSMSKDTRIIAAQGIRLVPIDYTVIGDTAAEDTRTYILGVDFAHIFKDVLAANVDQTTGRGILDTILAPKEDMAKRGALYKALEKIPQADRLLDPRWTVEVKDMILVKIVTVKLTAKAITYTKSSPLTK